ncbi:antigen p97 [Desmophyllum pertusum]|uniref:Antigen p97 n=1 Tax=Desmophyllum pertusum TaxID=174260 RepID=A0A9W9ZTT0_9CNID|nr:antigen p97 [Desmophyllum pertusum]
MVLVCAILSLLYICVGHGQAYPMRWCTTSAEEQTKCGAFIKVVNDSNVEVSCVQADSVIQCMEKIENGDADLITLDGGEVYLAGKKYGMVRVVNEQYVTAIITLAVAVAMLNSTVTMKNLKGKKTCHTGAGKTSVPSLTPNKELLGIRPLSNGVVVFSRCQKSRIDTQERNPQWNLCERMCPSECRLPCKYSGYSGALQVVLMDGVGEVAFVKHTTVMENVNASDASNYRYLCNDGSRAGTYFFKNWG